MRRGKARARTRAARLIGKTAAVTKTSGPPPAGIVASGHRQGNGTPGGPVAARADWD